MQKRSTVSWFGMVLPLTLAASTAAAQSATHRQEPCCHRSGTAGRGVHRHA